MHIQNRRYIGSKTQIIESIFSEIEKIKLSLGKEKIVLSDLFAGTGVVSEMALSRGEDVIINDLLYHNFVAYNTWMSNSKFDKEVINKYIERFNKENTNKENYFSEIYSNKYFGPEVSKKIGHIREQIENNKENLTKREYYILITSLLYSADKIANTVGHFEHYLSNKEFKKNLELKIPSIKKYKGKAKIYNMDANLLASKVISDIAYIDPPYNSRQYINFYHLLENLAKWDKPKEFEGKSMKYKRDHLKSDYSKSKAPEAFQNLIESLNTKYIIVSYNNTYNAKSSASNNKISEDEIKNILKSKGKLTIKEIGHKFFNSGKTDFKEHKEYLYICEVKNDFRKI